MKKKNNLLVFIYLFVGIIIFSAQTVLTQKGEIPGIDQSKQSCSGEKFEMPASISASHDAFENYLRLASLPVKDRRIAYRELPNEQKASFFKVQFALELIKRPALTKEQTGFILDAISKVSPDLYESTNPESVRKSEEVGQQLEIQAMSIFESKVAGEILAALFADKTEDAALLQKYDDLLNLETESVGGL